MFANPAACIARIRKSPDPSPVHTRPVRLPPCAAGARPSTSTQALGSPNPGPGFPQYVSFRYAALFSRAMQAQYERSRLQRAQATICCRMTGRAATPATSGPQLPCLQRFYLLVRVIGTTDERAGFHVAESHVESDPLQVSEFRRRVVSRHREIGERGAEVLSDRDDLAAGLSKIAKRRDDLVPLLAEPDHQAGLRRDLWRIGAGSIQQLQCAIVPAAGPRQSIQARDRLD